MWISVHAAPDESVGGEIDRRRGVVLSGDDFGNGSGGDGDEGGGEEKEGAC